MLHNVPLKLLDEQKAKEAYEELLHSVEHYNVQAWLEAVLSGFSENMPPSAEI
jgi:hypothetical protein